MHGFLVLVDTARRLPVRFGLVAPTAEEPATAPMQAIGQQNKAAAKSSVIPLPAPPRRTSRFGVAPPAAAEAKRASKFAPTRPVNTNDALFAAKSRPAARIRIPAALVASVVIGAAIIAVASYFWAYPEKLRSLGSLVAPPSPHTSIPEIAGFFPPPLDVDVVRHASEGTVLVAGDVDPYIPEGIADAYARPLKIATTLIPGGGHLNVDSGYGPWPAVLGWCNRDNLAFF